jgi:citrate synthase
MGTSDATSITVRGLDLADEVIGKIDLGDMAFLELNGRLPSHSESRVMNALLVTLVEHGTTPSTIAARVTYAAAPESIQAAIAAGICGVGTHLLGALELTARILQEGVETGGDVRETAAAVVAEHRASGRRVPGIGHPVHTPDDPRTEALWRVAAEEGLAGAHIELMRSIGEAADAAYGRRLPVNANGACAAVVSDLGLDWRIARGIVAISRCVGIVGHLNEELRRPIGRRLWEQADALVEYVPD